MLASYLRRSLRSPRKALFLSIMRWRLRVKYSRDDESAAMLDLIFNNRVFDFGDTIWCQHIRDGVFASMYMNDMRNIASRSAALNRVVNKLIQEAAEKFS